MRILYITPSFQHPKMRGSLRHYYFIRELSQRHAITLLTLTNSMVPAEVMAEMTSYTEQIFTFKTNGAADAQANSPKKSLLFSGSRLKQIRKLRAEVRQMKKTLTELVRQGAYDLLLFHGKDCFAAIEDWDDLPMVVDFCDATSMRVWTKMRYVSLAERPLLALRYLQVRQVEQKLIKKTPHLAFISRRDREAILGPDSKAEVVPNGVDLQYWQRKTNSPRPNRLVFTGVMNYAPNEDAALYLIEKILPRLRQSISDLEIFIVGRDPSPALLERARHCPEVTITGFVDDLRPYLEEATMFVAPLRYASGMQNKIQEALAMGVPIITTPIVAAGLRVEGGEEPPLYVADGERQFADTIVNLLGQEAERARLAAAGRRFAEKYFVWSQSARQLEQMCLDAVGIN
jgi:glycosyltransferase involved in cell wall biosynthesis